MNERGAISLTSLTPLPPQQQQKMYGPKALLSSRSKRDIKYPQLCPQKDLAHLLDFFQ